MNRPLSSAAPRVGGRSSQSCPCARPCQSAEQHSPFMAYGESVRFERGDRLWSQDEPADAVYAICTGAVKTVREWPNKKSMILDLTFRSGLVGAEAALPDGVRAATCVALTSGRAMRIDVETLRRVLREDPAAARALLHALARGQHAFAHRLDETQLGAVEERLARVLLRIADTVGLRDSRGTFVPVGLSRGDLAELVGCRVETVIRIMTRWQREEVVETQREGIVVKARGVLESSAAA